jgi:putative heme-binding domain-containing protein
LDILKAFPLSLLFAALPAIAQSPVANPHDTPADRAAGALIFRSHCAPCHGTKGTGGTGSDLTAGVFFHGGTDADLYRNISEGIPGTAMPDAFFDGTQIWQIVAYVRSLSQSAPHTVPKGNAVNGKVLVGQKGCTGCHLIRGEGGVHGPDLSVIGSQRSIEYLRESILDPDASVAQDYWTAKIIMNDKSEHTGFLMNQDSYTVQILDFKSGLMSIPRDSIKDFGVDRSSTMPSYKSKLTDTELDDIVSYLASLQRRKGSAE